MAVGVPQRAIDHVGRVRQVLDPERVGESLCGIDGDHDRVDGRGARLRPRAPPRSSSSRRRRCRSRSRCGARRSSVREIARIDHDAFGEIDEARRPPRTRRRARRPRSGPMSAVKRNGRRICGSGRRSASRAHCCCCRAMPVAAKPGGRRERHDLLVAEVRTDASGLGAHAGFGPPRAAGAGEARRRTSSPPPGPSATPARSSIANAVSTSSVTGVSSGMVTSITWHRVGVGEQLDHVGRLLADRPDPHRVEQPTRRHQEADGVARRPARRAR